MVNRSSRVLSSPPRLTFLIAVLQAAPVLVAERGLAEGQPVPELRAPDLAGQVRTLADFPGRATLLVFWEPDHERSVAAVCELAALAGKYDPGALATVASGREKADVERALGACPAKPAVLLDRDRAVFSAYQIIALPTAMLVAPDRKLLFKTAGFNASGLGAIETKLDEIYGRTKPAAAAPSGPPEAVRRYGMAQQLLKLGMRAQAEKALEDTTRLHPEFRPAWVSLGYCRVAGNRPAEALAAFEKALALDAPAADVAAGMAWVSWRRNDATRAAEWAGRASEDDPNYALIREIRKQPETGGPR